MIRKIVRNNIINRFSATFVKSVLKKYTKAVRFFLKIQFSLILQLYSENILRDKAWSKYKSQ